MPEPDEWVMGTFCLLWLLAILKIPWDLYFQATSVSNVAAMCEKLNWQEITLRDMTDQLRELREGLAQEQVTHAQEVQRLMGQREAEYRELRQSVHAISREFETTASRLTDNQEVIKGIQAFVRLIAQSTAN
ncbi:MAG TPA: hypothetical protein VKU00_24470 [Chthonomonadaceae bacterium]|nr:hypothetical protein [Chthonomonadaceae bacterium]